MIIDVCVLYFDKLSKTHTNWMRHSGAETCQAVSRRAPRWDNKRVFASERRERGDLIVEIACLPASTQYGGQASSLHSSQRLVTGYRQNE